MGSEVALSPPPPEPALALAVELGPLVNRLSACLGGSVPHERIEALIAQLLEQEFSDARVTAFLPIFLHRYALAALQEDSTRASPSRIR